MLDAKIATHERNVNPYGGTVIKIVGAGFSLREARSLKAAATVFGD
jgi:hypothetical protein